MPAPESKTKRGIVPRVLSPGGLSPAPTDSSMPTAELPAVGICLPSECLRMHEQSRGGKHSTKTIVDGHAKIEAYVYIASEHHRLPAQRTH